MFTPTPLHLSSPAAVTVQFANQEGELTEMRYSWLWLVANEDDFFSSTASGEEIWLCVDTNLVSLIKQKEADCD